MDAVRAARGEERRYAMTMQTGLHAVGSPFPADLERGFQMLGDGTRVRFRPVSPYDGEALKRFRGCISQRSVYFRYLGSMKWLPEAKAGRFTHFDGRGGFTLAALDPEEPDEIVALVLYVREDGSDRAEYAALVKDSWQGRGLGSGLTERLVEIARSHGIRRFWGIFLPENDRMLSLLRDLDLSERIYVEDGIEHVEIDLEPVSETACTLEFGLPGPFFAPSSGSCRNREGLR